MVCRLSGLKVSRDWRFVKMRVLEGGVGWVRGGRLERSRVSDFLEAVEDAREGRDGGDETGLVSCSIVSLCVWVWVRVRVVVVVGFRCRTVASPLRIFHHKI